MIKGRNLVNLKIVGQMITDKINFFLLFLLCGCTGFYTKPVLPPSSLQSFNSNDLNVFIEMSYLETNTGHIVDEIEIANSEVKKKKSYELKNNIMNFLKKEFPTKRINYLQNFNQAKVGCNLKIKFNESYNPNSMLLFGLTLGILPGIDNVEVGLQSSLFKDEILVNESEIKYKYIKAASIFLLPIVPFKYSINKTQELVWDDVYKDNLRKIQFNKCDSL